MSKVSRISLPLLIGLMLVAGLHWLYAPSITCGELGGAWDKATSSCLGNSSPLPDTWWPFD